MLVSGCAFLVEIVLIAIAPVTQTYWMQTFLSMIIIPWGMDMAFPAGLNTDLESNAPGASGNCSVSGEYNCYYSIPIGLGVAGTVVNRVDASGADRLRGYHSAWDTGMAFGGLSILLSLYLVFKR